MNCLYAFFFFKFSLWPLIAPFILLLLITRLSICSWNFLSFSLFLSFCSSRTSVRKNSHTINRNCVSAIQIQNEWKYSYSTQLTNKTTDNCYYCYCYCCCVVQPVYKITVSRFIVWSAWFLCYVFYVLQKKTFCTHSQTHTHANRRSCHIMLKQYDYAI